MKEFIKQEALVLLDEGDDNRVYVNTDKTVVYRIPKQVDIVEKLQKEDDILPELASLNLGVNIPLPTLKEYKGNVYATYPYVKNVRYMDLSDTEKQLLIMKLSTYLSKQHTVYTVQGKLQKIDYQDKCEVLVKVLQETFDSVFSPEQFAYAEDVCRTYLTFETGKSTILHGDMSFDHVFYSRDELTVIDWSDLHMGDPAYEFYHLLRACNEDQLRLFKKHYTTTDPHFWERAELYLHLDTLFVLEIGIQKNNESLIAFSLNRISLDMEKWSRR